MIDSRSASTSPGDLVPTSTTGGAFNPQGAILGFARPHASRLTLAVFRRHLVRDWLIPLAISGADTHLRSDQGPFRARYILYFVCPDLQRRTFSHHAGPGVLLAGTTAWSNQQPRTQYPGSAHQEGTSLMHSLLRDVLFFVSKEVLSLPSSCSRCQLLSFISLTPSR